MRLEDYLALASYNLNHAKALLPKIVAKEAVLGDTPSDYPSQFQHSDWDCEDSPTKYCMYTNHEYDGCIFCGEPDERK